MPLSAYVAIGGRALLALLFVLAGLSKIAGARPVLDHMRAEHVPTVLFPAVIAFEIGAGGALLIGWNTGMAAAALALFCLATAIVFHRNFAERAERTQFAKDIALAGALAFVAASSL
ncbi:MAG: DoxX family membrane protein [Rhizomicrobium sp.]